MAVLQRLRVTNTSCMVFASAVAARKCITALSTAPAYSEAPSPLQHVRFYMPPESNLGDKPTHWANFSAIIIPSDLWKEAMAFWRDTGTGLSSRHAEFCLEEFQYLDSDSLTPEFCTSAPQKRNHRQVPHYVARIQSAASRVDELKAFLANLATSEQPGEPEVNPDDVFLYPNGMNAIYSLSESLSTLKTGSTVVAYGYVSFSSFHPIPFLFLKRLNLTVHLTDGSTRNQSMSFVEVPGTSFRINLVQRKSWTIWRTRSSLAWR